MSRGSSVIVVNLLRVGQPRGCVGFETGIRNFCPVRNVGSCNVGGVYTVVCICRYWPIFQVHPIRSHEGTERE
jgi:hypothetical protein